MPTPSPSRDGDEPAGPEPAGLTIVCVLGMHRSGTSVAARVVNLLGVDLGREECLVRAADDNPKGFWEYQPIVELNDAILDRLGGNCVGLPAFPAGWERAPELEDLRARARAIVSEGFRGATVWGWKDPRTCLTLPFWRRLLPPMRYVLCLRKPRDVARSLRRRSGMPHDRGVYLWLTYTQRALEHTEGAPRCVVSYDGFIDDRMAEVSRLASFLGVPERVEQPDVRAAVAAFLDADLRHHRTDLGDGAADAADGHPGAALDLAEYAYATLLQREQFVESEVQGLLQQGLAAVPPGAAARPVRRGPRPGAWRDEVARWAERIRSSAQEITAIVPEGDTCVLADEDQLSGEHFVPGRRVLPFPERGGVYWGLPSDDGAAVAELERLRAEEGAAFLAVAWPAFWWLEYYAGFAAHLGYRFRCVLRNEQLVVYDLRERAVR